MIPPILMYHRIGSRPGDGITVSPKLFEKQLAYLKKNNFQTISLQTWYEHFKTNKPVPPKNLILTFDDGYQDNLLIAAPLLKKYGFTATVFVVADQIGKFNNWDTVSHRHGAELMSIDELESWLAMGCEISSHGMTHAPMSLISLEQMSYEATESKKILETLFNIEVPFFCYPYGLLNKDSKKILKEAGYHGALAILQDASWSPIDLFAIPRIKISEQDNLFKFAWKVSPMHNFFAQMKYYTQKFKSKWRSN